MDYLNREDPFSEEMWAKIDSIVVNEMKKQLIGRKFMPVKGPLGAGTRFITIDSLDKEEVVEDGFTRTEGRKIFEIPQIYADFWLYWRDLEAAGDDDADLSAAMMAAQMLAKREDNLIFYGNSKLGIDGLLTAKGTQSVKRGDWFSGEDSFKNVYEGITKLEKSNRLGRYSLIMSPDLFAELQRIQPGTGTIEADRIKTLITGAMLKSPELKEKTALLVCGEGHYMDLAIGQDVTVSIVDDSDLNQNLRILETAIPRIKAPDSIVVFK